VAGAREYHNGVLRELVKNSVKRSQGSDSVRDSPFSNGSLHTPYDLVPLLAVGKVTIKALQERVVTARLS
jgi:hypothetical protein